MGWEDLKSWRREGDDRNGSIERKEGRKYRLRWWRINNERRDRKDEYDEKERLRRRIEMVDDKNRIVERIKNKVGGEKKEEEEGLDKGIRNIVREKMEKLRGWGWEGKMIGKKKWKKMISIGKLKGGEKKVDSEMKEREKL